MGVPNNRPMAIVSFRYAADDRGVRNLGIGLDSDKAADNKRVVNDLEFGSPVLAIAAGSNIVGMLVTVGYAQGSSDDQDPWDEGYTKTHDVKWVSNAIFVNESDYPLANLNPGQEYLNGLMGVVLKKL